MLLVEAKCELMVAQIKADGPFHACIIGGNERRFPPDA